MREQTYIIESFTEMADRYEGLMNSELGRFWGIKYRDFVENVLSGVKLSNESFFIDIATGTAFIPQLQLSKNPELKHVFGLDLTFEMLFQAKNQLLRKHTDLPVKLLCASAHEMPFRKNVFDIATCCLATHHMDAEKLLANTHASLRPGGKLFFGDVGGSARWKIFFIRGFLRLAAFVYFLFTENLSRARAESSAVSNVRTAGEWLELMRDAGFCNISVREMEMNRFWIPNPVIIEAQKPKEA